MGLILQGLGEDGGLILQGLGQGVAIVPTGPGFYVFGPRQLKEWKELFPCFVNILEYKDWQSLSNVTILKRKRIKISSKVFIWVYEFDYILSEVAKLEFQVKNLEFISQPTIILKGIEFTSPQIIEIAKHILNYDN